MITSNHHNHHHHHRDGTDTMLLYIQYFWTVSFLELFSVAVCQYLASFVCASCTILLSIRIGKKDFRILV
jgi:hypothetical protein